jgi:hypothetical protein
VPAHRQMWVENLGAWAGLEVVMMDLTGQVSGTFRLEPGLNRLNISHVAPGVYILASGPASRSFCQKVVIE